MILYLFPAKKIIRVKLPKELGKYSPGGYMEMPYYFIVGLAGFYHYKSRGFDNDAMVVHLWKILENNSLAWWWIPLLFILLFALKRASETKVISYWYLCISWTLYATVSYFVALGLAKSGDIRLITAASGCMKIFVTASLFNLGLIIYKRYRRVARKPAKRNK